MEQMDIWAPAAGRRVLHSKEQGGLASLEFIAHLTISRDPSS